MNEQTTAPPALDSDYTASLASGLTESFDDYVARTTRPDEEPAS